jgi:hypothetical protein
MSPPTTAKSGDWKTPQSKAGSDESLEQGHPYKKKCLRGSLTRELQKGVLHRLYNPMHEHFSDERLATARLLK